MIAWDREEWQLADFDEAFTIEVPWKSLDAVQEVIRKQLTVAGFRPVSRIVTAGRSSTSSGSLVLFERPATRDVSTAIRDSLSPDGSALFPVTVALFGLLTAGWLALGGSPVGDPWTLTWVLGAPLAAVGIWLATRTRRTVRTVGIRVRLSESLSDSHAGWRGTQVEFAAANLEAKLTYPKPAYQARRALLGSEGTQAASPVLLLVRADLSGRG